MTEQTLVLSILSNESQREAANQLANLLGYSFSQIVIGDGRAGAAFIAQTAIDPKYILFVIDDRRNSADEELQALASQCVAGTKVVVAGSINDIQFYRSLMDRGVLDYFTLPLNAQSIAQCFARSVQTQGAQHSSKVFTFCSAAAGDGASTIAVNTAYAIAQKQQVPTIIVDMDYQFGMVVKNLDLSSPFGLKELLEHPDRGVDATLIERMAIPYDKHLKVIAAPNGLHYYPSFKPELIRDMIQALRSKYHYIILDMPRLWTPWVSVAFNQSDEIYLVAQLWLKSVSHAARQINAWKATGFNTDKVHLCVNRSGAKFKEGVTPKDFERVCGKSIERFFPNDIRTAVEAEQQGKTILELKKSALSDEIWSLSDVMVNGAKVK